MRTVRIAVAFAAVLVIALPLFALPGGGCSYECRRGETNGQAWAHCVQYFFGVWEMTGCREIQYCYRFWVVDENGWHLEEYCMNPDCQGDVCYNV